MTWAAAGFAGIGSPLAAIEKTGEPEAPLAGTLIDGNVRWDNVLTFSDGTPTVNFYVPAGTDHVFQNGWWFRIEGDSAESPLGTPDTEVYLANVATVTWNNVGGRNFAAQTVTLLNERAPGGAAGSVEHQLTLTNNSGGPLTFHVFNYIDYDLQPVIGNDQAVLQSPSCMRITHDSNARFADFQGVGASAYAVAAYPVVVNLLNNAAVNDLGSTGLPFAPADFAGAWQWAPVVVANGAQATWTVRTAVNFNLCDPVACELTCPNIAVPNDVDSCGALVNFAPQTTGDCGPIVCDEAPGSFPVGTTPVSCQEQILTAPTGGASCSFDIVVNDTQPPSLTPPANQNVGTDAGVCTAVVNYPGPVVWDNCPGVGVPTCAPPSGSTFNLGVTPTNCQVFDAAGNSAGAGFTVTVVDDEPPVAVAPAAAIGTDPGVCSAVFSYTPGYSDNCPGGSTACAPPPGSTFPLGDTVVNCTATDAAGLTDPDSGTVTVFDDEPPAIACPADLLVAVPPGALSWPVSFTTPTPTDNCPGVGAACDPASGDAFPVGTTTDVCTATDAAGLTSACDFDVTVTEQSIQEIPTASTLGLAALALLLAGAAFVALRRHG